MARLVTKFRYLKPSARRSAGSYARYIATRDGVEKLPKTYADYIALRPRAQRLGSHGLFTDAGVPSRFANAKTQIALIKQKRTKVGTVSKLLISILTAKCSIKKRICAFNSTGFCCTGGDVLAF